MKGVFPTMGLKIAVVLRLLLLIAVPSMGQAQTKESTPPVFPGQTEGNFIIKDFHFNSGEVLPELRLHYVTLGCASRSATEVCCTPQRAPVPFSSRLPITTAVSP